MSEQELNSYRFVSGLEPGDERLSQIMKEAAETAIARHQAAEAQISMKIDLMRKELRAKWSNQIKSAING
ncbi:hypothetical protein [Lepagella muris]|jgi:hypothetical protein|uniref:Uncharacterized protein n=1 Tax=Lepagella muris TaxID=3032870 RepID=A0AC61RBR2_9BACT|nr:hypothetical protein [Lepagella muris]ROT05431.1 hypothetical protein EEL33_12280 [Muribaculaceae bacterium Isolate-037 (Harlan)]TGY77629.1 hypothetical protein E5331_13700 [Lepagella muris]THG50577.1 hypothetical protein E5984_13205 [Bacteroidales bacterium]